MNMVGCGLMFTGLVLGALSGSIDMMLMPIGLGLLLIGIASLYRIKQHRYQYNRYKQYPAYRY